MRELLSFSVILILITILSCKVSTSSGELKTAKSGLEEPRDQLKLELPEQFFLKSRVKGCDLQLTFMSEHLSVVDSIYFESNRGNIIPEVTTFLEVIGENKYDHLNGRKNMHLFYVNLDCLNTISSLDQRIDILFNDFGQPLLKRLKSEPHKQIAITTWLTNYDCRMWFHVYPDNSISNMKITCSKDIVD